MNVGMLVKQLSEFDPNLEVKLSLRIEEDPEEYVDGSLTGCAKARDIETRKSNLLLVSRGSSNPKRRTKHDAARGSRGLSGLTDEPGR